ncbi:peroxidase 7 [Citrus sinensis]|nr:peroxidase 7 [Citrus sinensis]
MKDRMAKLGVAIGDSNGNVMATIVQISVFQNNIANLAAEAVRLGIKTAWNSAYNEQDQNKKSPLDVDLPVGDIGLDDSFASSEMLHSDEWPSSSYYHRRCPNKNVEKIINKKVKEWVDKDYKIAPSLLRLHYHDCAGCDGSILLNNDGSERRANVSKTLRGFEVIDDIKAELEKECPKTVSCADILAAAARDATVLLGGEYWDVPLGRKDGRVSIGKEADIVPMGHDNVTTLLEFFQSMGLEVSDLVILSGAHTIGRTSCAQVQDRIYNYKGTGKPDPSINEKYLNFLQRRCRWASEDAELDAESPWKFDNMYYKNLQNGLGLLPTDQLLLSDKRTEPIAKALASMPSFLYGQIFGASMKKFGKVNVLSGDEGEIRTNCNFVNSHSY